VSFFRDRKGDALNEEIDTHLSLLEDDYRRRGMSAADARDAARRAFGGVHKVRQLHRAERGLTLIDGAGQDIKFAMRVLRRDRGFALTAILVLGLGIGVNNMMFTIIYGHTLRTLPIERPERVLYVSTFDERVPDRPLSYPDLEDLQAAANFSGFTAFINAPAAVSDEGRTPERFDSAYVTANAFDVIGRTLVMGRTFAPDEERPGAPLVTLLSRAAWQSRYGGDHAILGRTILVNGTPATVIGVVPDRSGFPSTAQIWLPLSHAPGLAPQKRDVRNLRVFGRVSDVASPLEAQAEVESILDRIAREHPETSKGLRARVVPIHERLLGRPTDQAWLAFIAIGFLMLIVSCANVANLMLARAVLRAREIAIRGSLGASRWRVVSQLLIESTVLAGAAGVLGLLVSLAGVRLFASAIPQNTLPYWLHYAMDARIFAALIGVSFGTVLIFGLVPALQASRIDVNRVLKDGGRSGTTSGGARRWTATFLVAQFALTVLVLAQVIVSNRNTIRELPSEAAITSPEIMTAAITLPAGKYAAAEQRANFYRALEERLSSLPDVSGVAVADTLPLQGAAERGLQVEGQTQPADEKPPSVRTVGVSPRYFDAIAVPLERGRRFAEDESAADTAIVSRRFVNMFFREQDPVGRRIRLTVPGASLAPAPWMTIIGVAQDVRYRPVAEPDPVVYRPFPAASAETASLLVRNTAAPGSLTGSLRQTIAAIDPNLPLYRVRTMQQVAYEAEWNGRVSNRFVITLGLLALALSIVGLYAVTAHAVAQRRQEIGLRIALGARSADVRRLILRRAILHVALGLAAGTAGATAWDALFFSGRVDVRFAAPGVLIPIAALLVVVTAVACVVPLRRATGLDPATALRQD
jgi:predicted permease